MMQASASLLVGLELLTKKHPRFLLEKKRKSRLKISTSQCFKENKMSFDDILETQKYNKRTRSKLDKIRNQRQLASEILAGMLYHGFKLSEQEERFVLACNRSMRPIDDPEIMSTLIKINKRRWDERGTRCIG